jgi:hypothetical protein
MIGRCALGRAPFLALLKSFAAGDSFARGHRGAIPHIDGVNISFDRRCCCRLALSLHCQHLLAQDNRTLASVGHPFRDPGHLPVPPNRVRARPVLQLEEPAATSRTLDCGILRLVARVATHPSRDKAGLPPARPSPFWRRLHHYGAGHPVFCGDATRLLKDVHHFGTIAVEADEIVGLLIMSQGRRQILWLGVTAQPTAEWIVNQTTAACGWAWADGGVSAVDINVGETWVPAVVDPPAGRAWQRFAATVRSAAHGNTELSSRAQSPDGRR